MFLGYNTNGLVHHDLVAAIELLAEMGYRGVGISLDVGQLNPYADQFPSELSRVGEALSDCGMQSAIETGARYLLDPRIKHEPTLLSPDGASRARRIDFLQRSIDIAAVLDSHCVTLFSGVLRDDVSRDDALQRLCGALRPVVEHAVQQGVQLGFEPEPGMFIETMADFAELRQQMNADCFQLTLDVGHLLCTGETPIADRIRQWKDYLINVHIEDMRVGVHEHLMFGEGDMAFPPIFGALAEIDYEYGVYVELSRHSHVGPKVARQSHHYLVNQLP